MSTIKVGTLLAADGSTTTQPSIPALDQRMAKAWVNFNGATMAVGESYNVSSVSDLAVGFYGINFQTAMTGANYTIASNSIATIDTGGQSIDLTTCLINNSSQMYAFGRRLDNDAPSFGIYDCAYISAVVYEN